MDSSLTKLTGLTPSDLADTLIANSRAYMALRGAVAEKHLWNHLENLKSTGKIESYRKGKSDSDKDFYVRTKKTTSEIVVECKNVEVIKIKKSDKERYFKFVSDTTLNSPDVSKKYKSYDDLPTEYKQSGIYRYMFSAQDFSGKGLPNTKEALGKYLSAASRPLTIDFQRTRNSSNGSGEAVPTNRFYEKTEIDVLAICLFSRTLHWEFVFVPNQNFPVHPKYDGHYHNKFIVSPEHCYLDILSAFNELLEK